MTKDCPECGYLREERAAIHEFDGKVSRAVADELAAGTVCDEHRVEGNKLQVEGLKIVVVRWEKHAKQKGEFVGGERTLAGPYRFGFDGTREQVLRLYREWLWKEIKGRSMVVGKLESLLAQARQKEGLVLVCMEPEIGGVIQCALEWMAERRQ